MYVKAHTGYFVLIREMSHLLLFHKEEDEEEEEVRVQVVSLTCLSSASGNERDTPRHRYSSLSTCTSEPRKYSNRFVLRSYTHENVSRKIHLNSQRKKEREREREREDTKLKRTSL